MRIVICCAIGLATQSVGHLACAQTQVELNTWYSATRGDHFTTTDPRWGGAMPNDVRRDGGGSGYVMVRREGWVFNPAGPRPAGTEPLYSFWNEARGDNFITSDPRWTGRASVEGYARFRLEGYVYPTPQAGMVALRSFWSASRADNYASTDPRLAITLGREAGERTMSVEGGRYVHHRIEGYMPPPAGAAPPPRGSLVGLADLHTHPMAHLGFGKKLVHGVPDAFPDGTFGAPNGVPDGSIIPAGTRDCNATDTRAATIAQALGHDNSTHGGHDVFSNPCGDHQRNAVLGVLEREMGAQSVHGADKTGWPAFVHWPRHDDVTHQQMWVDWIRRAHAGDLRVMVALTVHNRTLGQHLLKGDPPFDDRSVGDLQLREMAAFVRRHSDFMELALSPADLRRIVGARKLAVVLGVELDELGNFSLGTPGTPTRAALATEIARLRARGVRYVFPLHMTDNPFGGTAVDESLFNVMNRLQTGRWWELECSSTVGRRFELDGAFTFALGFFGFGAPPRPDCPAGEGHRNARSLQPAGRDLVDLLMRSGMLIDVDHMSERTTDDVLAMARGFPSGWGYPLLSGHNGARGPGGGERSIRADQLETLRDLGGMMGLGWSGQTAADWHQGLARSHRLMGWGRVAFGTDTNGFSKLPVARAGSTVGLPWTTGTRPWDYDIDGVAQYGMLPDFVRDLRDIEKHAPLAELAGTAMLLNTAESFARTWERAELAGRIALAP